LVVDEVHHILNKESKYFSNVLSMTDRQYFLGVSATLEEKHVKFLNDSGCGVNYEITLKDGVDLGIIPEFIIYNLGIDLDVKSKNAFIKVNKISKELYSYFKAVAPTNTFELIMQCTSKDKPFKEIYVQGRKKILQNVLVNGVIESTIKYAIIAETYYGMGEDFINIVASTNNIEEKSVIGYANMWLRNMRTKNKICNDNPNRVKVITEFLKTNQVPTIVFNPSKEYSKMLFNESKRNSIEYHSGVTKSKRLKILPAFEEGLFKNLLCIKSLDEGANINSLELALNLGFDSLSLKLVQRIGRLLRYNPNKPDVTKCFINIHTNSFEYEDEDTFETVVEIPPDYKRLVKSQKNISGIEILTNINDVRSIDKGG
jgi:superfamily II DNA or RNA helicase